MNEFRFWNRITAITLGKLCRQRLLLAGVALLCILLPLCMGPVAENALSRGVSFSGITLAITAPEGDPVPQQLEQILPSMSDISQYCQVRAMEHDEAIDALERGEVTAVLVLPENFVRGVMDGTNPDVGLVVPADRPLESLLTLWIGQSASDMLAAFQSGIYAVLELYTENPPAGLSYQDVVAKINLRYISWMMNRQQMFRLETVSATGQLEVGLHYALSLLAFLALSLAPFFVPVFSGQWIVSQRRFRAAGRGTGLFYAASVSACAMVLFVLLTAARLAAGGSFLGSIAAGALCALFCAAFGTLCCLLTADTGSCGALAFCCSLVFLALSGGILPPVLMPGVLREWMSYSPVTWLRSALAMADGHEANVTMIGALVGASILMLIAGRILYGRRGLGEEASA